MKDYHAVLGVPKDASIKKIRKAYIDAIKFIHPDKFEMYSLEWENANKRLSEINEAYNALKKTQNKAKRTSSSTDKRREQRRTAEAQRSTVYTRPARKAPEPAPTLGDLRNLVVMRTRQRVREAALLYKAVARDLRFFYTSVAVCFFLILTGSYLYISDITLDQIAARYAFAQKAFAEQNPPHNGAYWNALERHGSSELDISTTAPREDNSGFYLVKVIERSTAKTVTVFIHAGKQTKLQFPEGTYEIRYAYGKKWYGFENLFGPDTIYGKLDREFKFYKSGEDSTRFSVRLYPNNETNVSVIEASVNSVHLSKIAANQF